jgi:hypothetical protein
LALENNYLRDNFNAAIDYVKEIQRCTCPPSPGEIRKKHEHWCPWSIADVLQSLKDE